MDKQLMLMQHTALCRMGAAQCVDVHCHCLAGLDDGPKTMRESLSLCKALVLEGITTVIATPHQLGRFDGSYEVPCMREAAAGLTAKLAQLGIPLEVLCGAEVRVDERVVEFLRQGKILTLGGDYLMIELPYEVFLDVGPLLRTLDGSGLKAIIAHPERNSAIAGNPSLVLPWSDSEAILQVTAASLVGRFGHPVQQAAWGLLNLPMTTVVATDAHDTSTRRPFFAEAFEAVVRQKGMRFARQVFVENPWRVVATGYTRQTRVHAMEDKAHGTLETVRSTR